MNVRVNVRVIVPQFPQLLRHAGREIRNALLNVLNERAERFLFKGFFWRRIIFNGRSRI